MSHTATPEQIRKAYLISATIVRRFGDAYLPVFMRLHAEVKKISEIEDIKAIAFSVASAKHSGNERD